METPRTFRCRATRSSTYPPLTLKLGTYYSTRDYSDVTSGAAHTGNIAYYLNADQTLWRENPKIKDDAQGLALYLIGEWALPDRNSYHYGFGGGPYYTGLLPGRDRDVLYFNLLNTRFSPRFSDASRAVGGPAYGFENRWQLNYQFFLSKSVSLTPELDYVVHPGGTGLLGNATVVSLRIKLAF